MRRFLVTLALLSSIALIGGCASVAADAGQTPAWSVDIGAGLRGPAGLKATVYATGLPEVAAFAIDADGRLWAATAAFEDDGGDAVYRIDGPGAAPIEVIADQHTVLGLAWLEDTLYVASSGRVDAYRDLVGDAFGTHETVLTLPDGVGEVNGLAISPDGRLALGVSAPCDACAPTTDEAAAVLSFLPDGTDLRVVASGIRAPVGLAYRPGTDDLFVTMNQRDDLGEATPGDWLAVVRSGQDWGFPDCYGQGGSACAGVPEPVAALDPHAAVSGLAIVGSSAFVAEWAKGTVVRVTLSQDGATFTGVAEPYLTGLTSPVPITVAPDGAILVGDWGTGTVYRIATT